MDIGGTFTDIVVCRDGRIEKAWKVSTAPVAPERAVVEALREARLPPISNFLHATTIATNAILGQKGLELPKVALIATKGFSDIIEVARQNRPSLYELEFSKPKPLVPRGLRFEVDERVNFEGDVLKRPADAQLRRLVSSIRRSGAECAAVCLLHSYSNPSHEIAVGRRLRATGLETCLSYEVDPEPGEYERTSTTVVNAALTPVVSTYLKKLGSSLRKMGAPGVAVMSSSGGLTTVEEAGAKPINLIESGPAAGLIAAAELCSQLKIGKAISFDMGGTTAKAGVVIDGEVGLTAEYEVGGRIHHGRIVKGTGYPVRSTFVDLAEVSSGGGSIVWKDGGGGINVGPLSAGAEPGPVAYGRGGSDPTVTDANLVLGVISEIMPGGRGVLRRDLATRAFSRLGEPTEVAQTALKIAQLEAARAIRMVTVERGLDPSEFTLIAFGGAGPQLAANMASELGVRRVLVPPSPGLFSALGLLVSDWRYELKSSYPRNLASEFRRMEARLRGRLGSPRFIRYADCRYSGQGSAVTIRLDSCETPQVEEEFIRAHRRIFGFTIDAPVQVQTIRVMAVVRRAKAAWPSQPPVEAAPQKLGNTGRNLMVDGNWVDAKVYQRGSLATSFETDGPALVDEDGSTTLVPPGWRMSIGRLGDIRMEAKQTR